MSRHPELEAGDYWKWATLLHGWGDDRSAWDLLSAHNSEPAFPAKPPAAPRTQLEATWHTSPQNIVNAQQLAQVLDTDGETSARDEVLVTVASAPKAPQWFVLKAAHVLAHEGRLKEAVGLLVQPGR